MLTRRAVEKHSYAIFLQLNPSHGPNAADVSPRVKAARLDTANRPIGTMHLAQGRFKLATSAQRWRADEPS